jgi:predicted CopG family antitoxin
MTLKSNKFKNVAVSQNNYQILKSLGRAGDSFNDVITKLLLKKRSRNQENVEFRDREGSVFE